MRSRASHIFLYSNKHSVFQAIKPKSAVAEDQQSDTATIPNDHKNLPQKNGSGKNNLTKDLPTGKSLVISTSSLAEYNHLEALLLSEKIT